MDINLSDNEHWIDYATADGASWGEDPLVEFDLAKFEMKQQTQPKLIN